MIDPWGLILAQAPDGEGVVMARLDYERLQRLRRELPCLRHRRLPLGTLKVISGRVYAPKMVRETHPTFSWFWVFLWNMNGWFPSSRLGTPCRQSSCFARESSIVLHQMA